MNAILPQIQEKRAPVPFPDQVNGTIHEGGKEYLVRRGFLRGVDVVNQNPDNVISFRDMQERIKRISRRPGAEPAGIELK